MRYDQAFSYDVRGNLTTQTRRNETGVQTDNLSYTLIANQNRLARVHDLSANALGHNNNGNANSGTIYGYDANGNITSDTYRGVSSISYNHLDLPTLVQRSTSNKLEMTYDADGNLLCRKTYTTSSTVPTETLDYIGNIEYVNNVIDQVHHDQGRYKSISAGVYRHEYTIADHLGNTRIVYADVNANGTVEQSEILAENHYYAYGLELPGSFINVAGTNYNYKFNGIERVESFGMDFAFYRGLDPILGRWYQVDPEAEMYYSMSPYCGMGNNPISSADPLGDSPVHVGAALIGAGINVYNNWSKIVKNPWSILGYAGTGAIAGAASLTPGGAVLAAKITAGGNFATDVASGNLPNLKSLGDVADYAIESGFNALDVAGAGKLAKAGFKGLATLGSEWAGDALETHSELVFSNFVTSYGDASFEIVDYTVEKVTKIGFGSTGFASFGQKALGITIDPKDQIDRGLLNKPEKRGNAPTFKSDGTKVEVHHVGQNLDGPFQELHKEAHRGTGVDKINHPNKGVKSQMPRSKFNTQRRGYWKKVFDLWK